jgi:hypothetical protein
MIIIIKIVESDTGRGFTIEYKFVDPPAAAKITKLDSTISGLSLSMLHLSSYVADKSTSDTPSRIVDYFLLSLFILYL